ncbi:MAG: hypothetical protein KAU44_00965, partial [Candidatus Marinimicrobia bacterium]|nr:hypothetical protein [Candidatus Neomarinimicrobiota bacterium]
MKKLILIFVGIIFCSFLFAGLNTVNNSKVDVNGTSYRCSAILSPAPFHGADLGIFNTLTLGGICDSYDNSGVGSELHYSFDGSNWPYIDLDDETVHSKDQYDTWTNSGDDPTIDISALSDGENTLYIYFDVFDATFPIAHIIDRTDYYIATFTKGVVLTFSDGSSFTPSVTSGSSDQAIGRFQLTGAEDGASLTDASIKLNGTRTGISNIKLWSSTDATFGSDTQLGSTVASDPGNGNTASFTFSGFPSSISTSGTYYFVTVDVASDATGAVQGVIVQNSSLTFNSSGVFSGTINNAVLSGSDVPLPITLASFVAEVKHGIVELSWETATETENSCFLVYRDGEVIAQLAGNGTCTEQHSYSYLDTRVLSGNHEYAISDISWGGIETKHAPVMIEIEEEIILSNFVLKKVYPNPFNPTTVI